MTDYIASESILESGISGRRILPHIFAGMHELVQLSYLLC
jgi:hypothetical protein